MTGEGTRPFAALAAAVLAAGALVACGDSGSSATSSSSETTSQSASRQPGTEAGSNGAGDGASRRKPTANGGSGGSRSEIHAAPLEVSGGGAAQFRTKGGDNSIQEFGEESDVSELEEAAAALHGFLVARSDWDWPKACSRLSRTVAEQLEQLASRSGKLGDKGCAGVLAALTPRLPAAVRRELTVVDAASLRLEGERAFLIYRGAEGTAYAIPMEDEDGSWVVASLAPTPLQ